MEPKTRVEIHVSEALFTIIGIQLWRAILITSRVIQEDFRAMERIPPFVPTTFLSYTNSNGGKSPTYISMNCIAQLRWCYQREVIGKIFIVDRLSHCVRSHCSLLWHKWCRIERLLKASRRDARNIAGMSFGIHNRICLSVFILVPVEVFKMRVSAPDRLCAVTASNTKWAIVLAFSRY